MDFIRCLLWRGYFNIFFFFFAFQPLLLFILVYFSNEFLNSFAQSFQFHFLSIVPSIVLPRNIHQYDQALHIFQSLHKSSKSYIRFSFIFFFFFFCFVFLVASFVCRNMHEIMDVSLSYTSSNSNYIMHEW